MGTRGLLGIAIGMLVLLGGAAAWEYPWAAPQPHIAATPASAALNEGGGEALPIPPVPPRIAEGPDYEQCMAMLGGDPQGAYNFADAWQATGGGDGAAHCLALSQIQLGDTQAGAEQLEKLAAGSKAPAAARAMVYGQVDQAWLMAGDANRALGAATLALILSPDDPDLLIDRSVASATLGQYEDAVDDLTHALDLDGTRADALVLRAAAWRHTGHLDLAQDDVDRALAREPENPEAYLERGILRERRGNLKGAQDDWFEAKTLAPDSATSDLAEQNLALLEAGPDQH